MARKTKANRRKRREIQATDAEWQVIKSAAGKVGVSTSEFVRRCAFRLDLSDGSTRKEDAAVQVLSSFDLIEKSLRGDGDGSGLAGNGFSESSAHDCDNRSQARPDAWRTVRRG
ncbi:hypothetical protein SAMN05216224_106243 [Thioclava dalianensis]|uniref:plasmid mobilization protein n=1 Tax=Thioclava dalianensis TaxID=1185766 RepID=UPI0008F6842E|nr:hypothetical protein [Thioclava dalianensis]SFN53869.1 hypothetical protein SAMN05216224_106243 [Thioclava dalianensis]